MRVNDRTILAEPGFRPQPAARCCRAVVNLLDWRALRPAADHLPYTISKARAGGAHPKPGGGAGPARDRQWAGVGRHPAAQ